MRFSQRLSFRSPYPKGIQNIILTKENYVCPGRKNGQTKVELFPLFPGQRRIHICQISTAGTQIMIAQTLLNWIRLDAQHNFEINIRVGLRE